jgi:competence protein ComFC
MQGLYAIKSLLKGFLDLFFPRSCIQCKGLVGKAGLNFICEACAQNFYWIHYPCCQRCAYPFFGRISGEKDCPQCTQLQPSFDRGRALFFMKGIGTKLIHSLKYSKNCFVIEDIKSLLRQDQALLSFLEGASLVPVPLHPKRHRQRGFNQSLLIAKVLASLVPDLSITPVLVRKRATLSQTHLSKEDRQKNVKNSFDLSEKSTISTSIRYVLVDDVFTTGATLNACSTVLKKAGAQRVDLFFLGRG